MIEQIKQALEKAAHGAEWTNFDGRDQSKVVYEYDRFTEETCDIIGVAETVELAQFIVDCPEWLGYLIGEVERLRGESGESVDAEFWLNKQVQRLEKENEELQKALEHYTVSTVYCGRCDSMSYDSGHGEVARQALERSESK